MQLKLKLPTAEAVARHDRTFQWDKDALIEEFGELAFIYGHWDRYFGCWISDRKAQTVRECLPDWVFLNEAGQGASPKRENSLRLPLRSNVTPSSAADIAFFAYFQSVPHHIRSLVRPLEAHQWAALDCIHQDPGFADFIDILLTHRQKAYLHACFSLFEETWRRSVRKAYAQKIRSMSRCALLNELTGRAGLESYGRWTEGRLRLLYKVQDPITSREDVEEFLRVTAGDLVQAYGSHIGSLSLVGMDVLQALGQLNDDRRRLPNILESLCRTHETETVRGLLYYAHRKLETLALQRLLDLLPAIKTEDDVALLRVELEDQLELGSSQGKQLPPPPFSGDELITPLSSSKDLENEGRRMRNCVPLDILDVVDGVIYYYHWRQTVEATVQIRRVSGRWVFGEARGYRNRCLPDGERRSLIEHVQRRLGALGSEIGEELCSA